MSILLSDEEIVSQIDNLLREIADGTWDGIKKGTTTERKISEFYEDWVTQQKENLKAQLKKVVDEIRRDNGETLFLLENLVFWNDLVKEVE